MKPSEAVVIVALVLALLAAPAPSDGQQPPKVYRIGYLGVNTGGYETNPQLCPTQGNPSSQAWVAGLRERGYNPGQNLVIECRWTDEQPERAPALATEFMNLNLTLSLSLLPLQRFGNGYASSHLRSTDRYSHVRQFSWLATGIEPHVHCAPRARQTAADS